MGDDAANFEVAAGIVADLVGSPEVGARWDQESACAGMSVGGLAHHLGSQPELVVQLFAAGAAAEEPIALEDHYARAAWVREGLDGESNVAIREGSDEEAREGQGALVERVRAAVAQLSGALRGVSAETPVLIPWQGWALTAHDLLTTRMMEMVVHTDDLAASIGVETPEFPDDVVRRVLDLLARVAVRRHGQAAVVRALSRPQRAPGSVSAF